MKTIGFIDWFIDEWHANHYPAWIRDNIAARGRSCELGYAWAEIDKPGGRTTADWCRKYQIAAAASLEELMDRSDYLIVLAPSHPEHHERLAHIPLASGKPVYVDKPFSPDLQAGLRMFERAAKHGTPMFSSSALRFAEELAAYPDERVNPATLEYMAVTGPGQFQSYSVHQLEMIVAMMGTGARRVKSLSTMNGRLLVIEYADGRQASMQQTANTPFQASMQLTNGEAVFIGEMSHYFERLIDAILDFFETGRPPVAREETLEIMALIEAGQRAIASRDVWIHVEQVR